jgi:hypothetical protein
MPKKNGFVTLAPGQRQEGRSDVNVVDADADADALRHELAADAFAVSRPDGGAGHAQGRIHSELHSSDDYPKGKGREKYIFGGPHSGKRK